VTLLKAFRVSQDEGLEAAGEAGEDLALVR
jgi:hypothetical protein